MIDMASVIGRILTSFAIGSTISSEQMTRNSHDMEQRRGIRPECLKLTERASLLKVSPNKTPPSSGPEYTRCRCNIKSTLPSRCCGQRKGNIGFARHEAKLLSGLEVRSRQNTVNAKFRTWKITRTTLTCFTLRSFHCYSEYRYIWVLQGKQRMYPFDISALHLSKGPRDSVHQVDCGRSQLLCASRCSNKMVKSIGYPYVEQTHALCCELP